jgi:hypothetical protein
VFNKYHLKRLMNEHVRYYHDDRTHLSLDKDSGRPEGREGYARPCEGGFNTKAQQSASPIRPRRLKVIWARIEFS